MSPPTPETEAVGGGGVAPSPSLPDRVGWGNHLGRAATSATPRLAKPGHVLAVSLLPLHRVCTVFRRAWGSHRGAKGTARPRSISRGSEHANAAASLTYRYLSSRRRLCPRPPTPLLVGSVRLPQPGNVELRRRKDATS